MKDWRGDKCEIIVFSTYNLGYTETGNCYLYAFIFTIYVHCMSIQNIQFDSFVSVLLFPQKILLHKEWSQANC